MKHSWKIWFSFSGLLLGMISWNGHAIMHLIPEHKASVTVPFSDVVSLFYWKDSPAVFSPKAGKIAVLDIQQKSFQVQSIPLTPQELAEVVDVSDWGDQTVMITSRALWLLTSDWKVVKKVVAPEDGQWRRVRCYQTSCFILSPKQNSVWQYRLGDDRLVNVSKFYQEHINSPFDLMVIPWKDSVFISNLFSNDVARLAKDDPLTTTLGRWGVWESSFSFPKGIEWDSYEKRLWVVDSFLHVAQAFNVRGEFLGVLSTTTGVKYFSHPFLIRIRQRQISVLDLFPPVVHVYDARKMRKINRQTDFAEKYGIRFNYLLDRALTEQPDMSPEKAVLNLVSFYKKAVCIQCHDTSFRDSRFIWESVHHPFDIRSKETGQIPETVPKDLMITADGLGCGTCHVPHHMEVLDPQEGMPEKTRVIRPQEDLTADIFLRFSKSGLCLKCHEDHLKLARGHVDPMSPKKGEQCFDCHHPHRSQEKFLTQKETVLGSLCISCHEKVHRQGHPIRGIHTKDEIYPNCSSCHKMHTDHDKLLVLSEEKTELACTTCHEEMKSVANSAHHFKNTPYNSACLGCHGVHDVASDAHDLAAVRIKPDRRTVMPVKTATFSSTKTFCVTCHGTNRLDDHGVIGVSDQQKLKDTDYHSFLFTPSGKKIQPSEAGYITCNTCHNVHQPCDAQECQADPHKGKFLRAPTDAVKFCSACHGEESLIKFRYFHRPQSREKFLR